LVTIKTGTFRGDLLTMFQTGYHFTEALTQKLNVKR